MGFGASAAGHLARGTVNRAQSIYKRHPGLRKKNHEHYSGPRRKMRVKSKERLKEYHPAPQRSNLMLTIIVSIATCVLSGSAIVLGLLIACSSPLAHHQAMATLGTLILALPFFITSILWLITSAREVHHLRW